MVSNFKLPVLLIFLIILIISISLQAEEKIIDPYNYNLILGKVVDLKGEALVIKEDGQSIKLNNDDLISSKKINQFMLIYSDNAETLTGGRKDMEEKLIIKTSANSTLKLLLNSNDENGNNFILLGPNTELKVKLKGGCLYSTEHDGEGYDPETLMWRHIKKAITWNLLNGSVKVSYQQNDEFRLGAPTTENAHIHIDNGIENIEYEVIVLKGEEAQQQDVKVESLTPQMNAQIEAIKNNYLLVYKVNTIEELPADIKTQLAEQIEMFKESYQEAENTMNEMMDQTRQIVTILKIYQGKAKLENTELQSGEMAKVKGDIGRASSPTKI